MSNILNPDPARYFVGHEMGPNYLQKQKLSLASKDFHSSLKSDLRLTGPCTSLIIVWPTVQIPISQDLADLNQHCLHDFESRANVHKPGPKVIKLVFMLNSTEHEKLKYRQIKKFAVSLSDVVFILLINVKMPTIVGILTFMSRINFVIS